MNEIFFETVAPGLGNPYELLAYVYNNAWIDWYVDPGTVLTAYDIEINGYQDALAARYAFTPQWSDFGESMKNIDICQNNLHRIANGTAQPGGPSAAELQRIINTELARWGRH